VDEECIPKGSPEVTNHESVRELAYETEKINNFGVEKIKR